MKISSIRYLIKEGFKGAWANRLMSLASIGVLVACMVVIGLSILISENVTMAVGNLEKQNVVMVYMKDYNWALYSDELSENTESAADNTSDVTDNADDVDDAVSVDEPTEDSDVDVNGIKDTDYVIHNDQEAQELCDKIATISNVETVEYISSEAGLQNAKDNMLGEQGKYFTFLDDEYGNPLSAAAKVTMKEMALFDETIKQINDLDGVDVIVSHGDLAGKIDAIKQGIYVAGFWIIGILVVISLVIVSNTIRVTMYNRKLEISIMKAVGATDTFIRIPFVIEGMLIGLISALISEALIYFCYRVATEKISAMLGTVVPFNQVSGYLMLVFIGIGVFAGALGSVFMIGKYLKREGSEFTAI